MIAPRRARIPTLVLAASLLALSGCEDAAPQHTAGPITGTPSHSPSGSPSPTPTSSAPSPTDSPGSSAAPAYFVGRTPQGPRLFREFQKVTGDRVQAAALLVDGGSPLDPDYRTLWPGGVVESASATADAITVDLAGDAFTERPEGMRRRDAALALQQMVHTLQGAAQSKAPVQFRRASGPQTLFGVDVSAPVGRADFLDVLALVNVTTPEQGSTVSGTLKATGLASSFEATVPWKIRSGGKVVLRGAATAEGWLDRLYPWAATIDVSTLEPGVYTFVAMTDDPSDGEGGGPTRDTKDFTVS